MNKTLLHYFTPFGVLVNEPFLAKLICVKNTVRLAKK